MSYKSLVGSILSWQHRNKQKNVGVFIWILHHLSRVHNVLNLPLDGGVELHLTLSECLLCLLLVLAPTVT